MDQGNFGTVVQEIYDDLHFLATKETIRRYVIKAMRFMRDRRYWFSQKVEIFTLTAGRRDYKPGDGFGLPAGLVEIVGKTIWINIHGSEDQRWPCTRIDVDGWDWERAATGNSTGTPSAWIFERNTLRFEPPSENSDDTAEVRYVTDIGVPRTVYDGGAYKFFSPTGVEMTAAELDALVNDWVTQEGAAAMVRARAMHELLKGPLREPEAAAEHLATWLENVGQLENETDVKHGGLAELPACIF